MSNTYARQLAHLPNVTVSSHSPLLRGQHTYTSPWRERLVETLNGVDFEPWTAYNQAERLVLIKRLASWAEHVWVRPATYGGRVRVWFKFGFERRA